jgi:acyl homoserine lactone synthase
MIRFLYGDQLESFPALASSMFRDRAVQFHDRLQWQVRVNDRGEERDEYDDKNPLYVIWELADGSHGGSMRFLPTTAETMVNDHFLHLTDGVRIMSPLIWECTRFCISPRAGSKGLRISGALMLAGCEMGLRFGLDHAVGVFDERMIRIYQRMAWSPDILGTSQGAEAISVGLWAFSAEARERVAAKCGFASDDAAAWFDASFPSERPALVA